MVQHQHFKSRVRVRMAKTGESYTAARRQLLAAQSVDTDSRGPVPAGTQYDASLWHHVLAESGVLNPATGAPFSEAMLAGLAGGIGFMVATISYESVTTATVVLRAHPEPYTDRLLERCGAPIEVSQTGSAKAARASLDAALDAGRPVVVRATHGALPWIASDAVEYLDSIDIAVTERESGQYLIVGGGPHPGEETADDAGPRRALPAELAAARVARKSDRHWASWVAPSNEANGSKRSGPAVEDLVGSVRAAVTETTGRLLGTLALDGIPASWMPKFGVAGMRTWAALLRDERTRKGWPAVFDDPERLRTGLEMVQSFLAGSRWGGPGGLRGLYAAFLTEAAELPGLADLAGTAGLYRELAPSWDALADAVDPGIGTEDRVRHFAELAERLEELAEREEAAARTLAETLGATGAR
ncbi:BtrH N-terminal domain-containing protein [Citricoccus nitrophenolicus]|uniref:BtrH N-terminal domain-containing protein n=1 Tax=Citricoccus nitrophenolicus TaxID=863575 RepID=UPI0031E7F8FC